MEKKRIIKSYDKLTPELKKMLKQQYPDGYADDIIKLTNAKKEVFFAIPLETEDYVYLIKLETQKVINDDNTEDFIISQLEVGNDDLSNDPNLDDE